MEYMVVVTCAEQRHVIADDPIDAIKKAISPGRDTTDELWEWDYKVERVHVWVDGEERRIQIPRNMLTLINKNIKAGYNAPQVFGTNDDGETITEPSWSQIRKDDIDSVKPIALKKLLRKIAEAII